MADLKELGIVVLSTTTGVNMTLDVPTLNTLYTVPPGKLCIIDQVIVHSNSADLVGMTDVDFGGGVLAATPPWKDAENGLADMTAVNDFFIVRSDDAETAMLDGDDSTAANRIFGMLVTLGSTGAANASITVYGTLF